jgi:hypothetical protein
MEKPRLSLGAFWLSQQRGKIVLRDHRGAETIVEADANISIFESFTD